MPPVSHGVHNVPARAKVESAMDEGEGEVGPHLCWCSHLWWVGGRFSYSCRTHVPSGTRCISHASVPSGVEDSFLAREYMCMPTCCTQRLDACRSETRCRPTGDPYPAGVLLVLSLRSLACRISLVSRAWLNPPWGLRIQIRCSSGDSPSSCTLYLRTMHAAKRCSTTMTRAVTAHGMPGHGVFLEPRVSCMYIQNESCGMPCHLVCISCASRVHFVCILCAPRVHLVCSVRT